MKLIGIYVIKSKATEEVVFASGSDDIRRDWFDQLQKLRFRKHPDLELQNHFNKYGKADLILTFVPGYGNLSKSELITKAGKYKDGLKVKKSVKVKAEVPKQEIIKPEVEKPKKVTKRKKK